MTFAQSDAYDGPTVIYSNQFYFGANLSAQGLGISAYHGKYDDYRNISLKGIEYAKIKHVKEFKLPSNGGDNSRRFAYGKLNSFQTLRGFISKKKLISDKLRKGALSIGLKYSFGASLGLLKPVYVEVVTAPGFTGGAVSIERYDPEVHDFGVIVGRANFLHGLDEIKLEPGLCAKFSLLFEISGERDGIQQVETGLSLDAFSRRVPIMEEGAKNNQFFANLFLSYSLGKKYNKR